MPAWFIPALKAVLPHVGTIVSATAPVFTRKSADAAPDQTALLQQQITELQAAASANDAHIKGLAAQIQNTVETLEKAAALAESRHRRILTLCVAASILSVISLGAALFLVGAR
ncbi:MAG: hypothetical protein JJE42_10195 [Burkholderiales bacterium]|nr:hypothetical protein [Burkholderiales bacterium]